MEGSLSLSQSLKQEQTLSPQMLQALALLPMPLMELREHIQNEIESNPALEIPDSAFDMALESPPERTLDDRMDDADSRDYEDMSFSSSYDPEASDKKQMMIENSAPSGESLSEHLMVQLGESKTSKTIYEIGEMLISNLDSNGFFILSLDELFEKKDFDKKDIEKAIELVQGFDPSGICVKDFRESLVLQARQSGMAESDIAIFKALVYDHLEKLKAGKMREVASSLRIPEEDVQTFFSILKSFTPYPGQGFSSDAISSVEPDFSVHRKNGGLVLDINRSMLPELTIADGFEELGQYGDSSSYVKDCIKSAKSLISQVNMRFKTLFNAATAIMEIQSAFFLNGPRALKSMTLKDVAEKIGVHETTMSRLAQSKYVETDWGLFQLKYLFSQGVSSTSDDSAAVSRNAVKDMIAEIVAENGSLSDQKISDLLLSRGIKCARRTVGKYRAELNIDSSYTR